MSHPLRAHLETVAGALRSDAMVARVQDSWNDPTSRPEALIGPPATRRQMRRLQDTHGGPLPDTLREVLEEVSANIRLSWAMRGQYEKADWGGKKVVTDVTPPEPFLEWSRAPQADGTPSPGAVKSPFFISGSLYFSLDEIEKNLQRGANWQDVYPDDPSADADTRAHYALIRDFMSAGLPVMVAGNGDWLAIDQRDNDECMLHVSHEGEEAGMEIDLTLINFLAHQSWLGPVTPDFMEVFTFSNSITDVIPDDYRVREVTFDATSEKGKLWRDWFWGEAGITPPDASLLTRCSGPPLS